MKLTEASGRSQPAEKEEGVSERLPHDWDEDACCIYCGFDGAEAWHLRNNLRLTIGNDEYSYRRQQGEFDSEFYCAKRERV